MRDFMCSSHTLSGVMPGGPAAARHSLDDRLAACAAAGYSGYWLRFPGSLEQRAAGLEQRGRPRPTSIDTACAIAASSS